MSRVTIENPESYADNALIQAMKGGAIEQVKTSALISIAASLIGIERHLRSANVEVDDDPNKIPRQKPNPTPRR